MAEEFTFLACIWLFEGQSAWHFVTVPKAISTQIRDSATDPKKAFGSIRVEATIGRTRWKTSIFPDKKRAVYVLPLKAAVRQQEQLQAGEEVEVLLVLGLPAHSL